ncbi:unnamed protein product [Lampetra planeri]
MGARCLSTLLLFLLVQTVAGHGSVGEFASSSARVHPLGLRAPEASWSTRSSETPCFVKALEVDQWMAIERAD